jgi:hypothetical protein
MIPLAGNAALTQALYMRRKKLGRAGRNKKRIPQGWLYPWATEKHYAAAIRAWLRPMMDYVHTYLKNNEEAMLRGDSAALVRQDAIPGGTYHRLVKSLNGWFTEYLPNIAENGTSDAPPVVFMGLGNIAENLNDFNNAQWQKSAKAELGVEFPMYEEWWSGTKQSWQEQNYRYFQKMGRDYIDNINSLAEKAVTSGWSVAQLAAEIQKIDNSIKKGRANLIARDQIGKLNEQVTQARMEQAGLTMYIWSTAKDERVRGYKDGHYPNARPSHYAMEGLLCRWSDSTVYSEDKGKTWKPRPSGAVMLHPGQDIQCRCTALSFWDELVGDVDGVIADEEKIITESSKQSHQRRGSQPLVKPEVQKQKTKIAELGDAINAKLSELRKWGKETKREQASLMAQDGKVLGSLKGKSGEVSFTSAFITKMDNQPKNSAILMHNHPSSTSFSKADFNVMCSHTSIKEMRVVGSNGKTYYMAVGNGERPSCDELDRYEKEIQTDIQQAIVNKMARREYTKGTTRWSAYLSERNKLFAEKYGWDYQEGKLNG